MTSLCVFSLSTANVRQFLQWIIRHIKALLGLDLPLKLQFIVFRLFEVGGVLELEVVQILIGHVQPFVMVDLLKAFDGLLQVLLRLLTFTVPGHEAVGQTETPL